MMPLHGGDRVKSRKSGICDVYFSFHLSLSIRINEKDLTVK